jgi:hypothetical protein
VIVRARHYRSVQAEAIEFFEAALDEIGLKGVADEAPGAAVHERARHV